MKKAILSTLLVAAAVPAIAAPPMPPQQISFCKLYDDLLKEQVDQDNAPPQNAITAARSGPKVRPAEKLYPSLVQFLGRSGHFEGWSGTLNGLGVTTESTGVRADTRQVIRTTVSFTCPGSNIDQQFNFNVQTYNVYGRPPEIPKDFGTLPLNSSVATDLSKLASGQSVVFSGEIALVKERLSNFDKSFFLNLMSIKGEN